ncbi:MAG: hypothetical protein ABIY47_06450 [Opitutaceae bacterium]
MKPSAIFVFTWVALFSGCASRYVDPLSRPLVDDLSDVVRFEGKDVRLVGVVSNTKIAQILGVDVTSDHPDLRGMQAEAYGILQRRVVSKEEARDLDTKVVAHRGAGIFWILYDPKTRAPAQVGQPPIVSPITVPAR